MRQYAMSYPQLGNAAIDAGYSEPELARLRHAYGAAQRMTNGLYRPNGTPFLGHLIRSAGILLVERCPPHVVIAALVHAALRLGYVRGKRRRVVLGSRRSMLMAEFGEDVVGFLYAYDQLPWNTPEALDLHLREFDRYDGRTRQTIHMRLANELEEAMDGGHQFASQAAFEKHHAIEGRCLMLAKMSGSAGLVADLEEAYSLQARTDLPDSLVMQRRLAYGLTRLECQRFDAARSRVSRWAGLVRRWVQALR